MSRPEHSSAPNIFYDEVEAKKYSTSSRMLAIQREIALRALELLNLDKNGPKLLLDVGCGSGLSGNVLADQGHTWIGLDISPSMLTVAKESLDENEGRVVSDESEEDAMEEEDTADEVDDNDGDEDLEEEDADEDNAATSSKIRGSGDLLLHDMGQGLNFRPNSFDGCVSVSAVQWLCNSYDKSQIPQRRLRTFFSTLYSILRRGARAAIQLYPENPQQMEMITHAAMSSGFTGGIVVDYPNSAKAKKFYLVLFTGGASGSGSNQQLPRALGTNQKDSADFETQRGKKFGKKKKRDRVDQPATKSKDWIQRKKERQRKQGKDVRPDSKFSGRRRKPKF